MANGVCLVVSYFLFRVAWTLGIVLHICKAWADLWRLGVLVRDHRVLTVAGLSFLCVAHLTINLFWFSLIIRQARRLLAGASSSKVD